MSEHRHCFQLRLTSLFLLTLLVATFFAGYSLATRQAKAGKRREAQEAAKAYLKALPKRSERIKELYSRNLMVTRCVVPPRFETEHQPGPARA